MLAKDEVAYVGEAVAIVVARTRAIAEDAAALVEVDYEPLPAVSDCRGGAAPRCAAGASQQVEQPADRVPPGLRRHRGGVCARAAHARAISLKQHRGGAHSMEGRGAVAVYDTNEDRLTLWTSTQLAHEVRAFLMRFASARREPYSRRRAGRRRRLRREVRDLSRGGRGCARRRLRLRRPVKWIEDRREHFLRGGAGARSVLGLSKSRFDSDGRVLGRARRADPRSGRVHAARASICPTTPRPAFPARTSCRLTSCGC